MVRVSIIRLVLYDYMHCIYINIIQLKNFLCVFIVLTPPIAFKSQAHPVCFSHDTPVLLLINDLTLPNEHIHVPLSLCELDTQQNSVTVPSPLNML